MRTQPTIPARPSGPAEPTRHDDPDVTSVDILPPPLPATDVGSRVGRYELRKQLGQGGMGCVYLAWDEQLRRNVAVKVLLPELTSDAESKARFLRESRAAAAVTHDHIVTVYEAGQDGDTAYMAMQYLHGVSLHKYLKTKGNPPIPVAVRIAREVAAGLASAHAAGLLHRDIKPGNILLEAPKGRVKILDFGLAAPFAPDDCKLTQTGLVVGTPAYMSPEQARCWKLDHRSDLFSLGVVLYQLCTGELPFNGPSTMEILTALATLPPVPVGKRNPDVPARLELLIARLLEKSPGGRPQSAAEVVADLRSIERELVDRDRKVVEAIPVVLADETPTVPDPTPMPGEALIEPDTEPEAESGRTARKRASRSKTRSLTRRTRRAKKVRERRMFAVTLAVMLGVLGVGVIGGLWMVSRALRPAATPTPPSVTTPPTPPEKGVDPAQFHPRDLPPGWPPGKPLPPGWRPGMPLPPDQLLPRR